MPEHAPPPAPPPLPPESDKPLRATYHCTLAGRIIRRPVAGPDDARPVNRQSLTIFDSRIHKGRWFRECQDIVVDPAQLRLWRNERTVPWETVKAAHKALRRNHPPDAGLAAAAMIDSSPFGEDPGLTTGMGPTDRFPISLSHAYLPTVLPALDRHLQPQPKSAIALAMGVGRIALNVSAEPVSSDSFERIHRLTAPPQEHTARTDDAALTLHFSGDWIIAYRDDPRFPVRIEGSFKIRARSRGQRKGRPIDLIAAEDSIQFKLKRVPLNFTGDPTNLVVFAGWKFDLP